MHEDATQPAKPAPQASDEPIASAAAAEPVSAQASEPAPAQMDSPAETMAPQAELVSEPAEGSTVSERVSQGASTVESTVVDAGHKLEHAARDLGGKLDEKLLNNQTGREVKEKVSGFWGRIKEKIK
jgi:hypothetical protein